MKYFPKFFVFILLLLAVLVLPLTIVAQEDELQPGLARTRTLENTIRAEQSLLSDILGLINLGTVVTVTEIDGRWSKVEYEGVEGWVYTDNLINVTEEGLLASPFPAEFLFDMAGHWTRTTGEGEGDFWDLRSGQVAGPQIQGEVVNIFYKGTPRPDGVDTIESQVVIRTDDGEQIDVSFQGIWKGGIDRGWAFVHFETESEEFDWLNKTVGVAITAFPGPTISFYALK